MISLLSKKLLFVTAAVVAATKISVCLALVPGSPSRSSGDQHNGVSRSFGEQQNGVRYYNRAVERQQKRVYSSQGPPRDDNQQDGYNVYGRRRHEQNPQSVTAYEDQRGQEQQYQNQYREEDSRRPGQPQQQQPQQQQQQTDWSRPRQGSSLYDAMASVSFGSSDGGSGGAPAFNSMNDPPSQQQNPSSTRNSFGSRNGGGVGAPRFNTMNSPPSQQQNPSSTRDPFGSRDGGSGGASGYNSMSYNSMNNPSSQAGNPSSTTRNAFGSTGQDQGGAQGFNSMYSSPSQPHSPSSTRNSFGSMGQDQGYTQGFNSMSSSRSQVENPSSTTRTSFGSMGQDQRGAQGSNSMYNSPSQPNSPSSTRNSFGSMGPDQAGPSFNSMYNSPSQPESRSSRGKPFVSMGQDQSGAQGFNSASRVGSQSFTRDGFGSMGREGPESQGVNTVRSSPFQASPSSPRDSFGPMGQDRQDNQAFNARSAPSRTETTPSYASMVDPRQEEEEEPLAAEKPVDYETTLENLFTCLNAERIKQGLAPLTAVKELAVVAQARADELASGQDSRIRLDGRVQSMSPEYRYNKVAENVHEKPNGSSRSKAGTVVNAWISSMDPSDNPLNDEDFANVGLGYALTPATRNQPQQQSFYVVVYGDPLSQQQMQQMQSQQKIQPGQEPLNESGPSGTSTAASRDSAEAICERIFHLTNQERSRSVNMEPLIYSPDLAWIAQSKAEQLAGIAGRKIEIPPGFSQVTYNTAVLEPGTTNLAEKVFHDVWMQDPGAKDKITDRTFLRSDSQSYNRQPYTDLGIGYATDDNGRQHFVQVFASRDMYGSRAPFSGSYYSGSSYRGPMARGFHDNYRKFASGNGGRGYDYYSTPYARGRQYFSSPGYYGGGYGYGSYGGYGGYSPYYGGVYGYGGGYGYNNYYNGNGGRHPTFRGPALPFYGGYW